MVFESILEAISRVHGWLSLISACDVEGMFYRIHFLSASNRKLFSRLCRSCTGRLHTFVINFSRHIAIKSFGFWQSYFNIDFLSPLLADNLRLFMSYPHKTKTITLTIIIKKFSLATNNPIYPRFVEMEK